MDNYIFEMGGGGAGHFFLTKFFFEKTLCKILFLYLTKYF